MIHRAENLEQYDPGELPTPREAEPVLDWFETRMVAVFAVVVATLVVIVAWRALNM